MKKTLEKIAVLSLSLLLVSTYAVSAVLPKMLEHFSSYPRARVELLVSLPSFGIAIMIFANIWLTRFMKEKVSILLGALLIVLSSVLSMKTSSYGVFFCARLLLGLGIGLINARAITTIQNRYEGKELSSLLGIRGSMEVLGSTLMTFLAGRLMLLHWNLSFAVYLLVIPVLILYLAFVQEGNEKTVAKEKTEGTASKQYLGYILIAFLLGFAFINTNVSTTMRMASLMMEKKLGSEADASVLLSYMQMVGVVAGVLFSRLYRRLGKKTMVLALGAMGVGLLIIGYAPTSLVLYLGGAFAGFSNGILATTIFQDISDTLPVGPSDTATFLALFGCNLGGAATPFLLRFLDQANGSMYFSYVFYGVFCLALMVLLFFLRKEKNA